MKKVLSKIFKYDLVQDHRAAFHRAGAFIALLLPGEAVEDGMEFKGILLVGEDVSGDDEAVLHAGDEVAQLLAVPRVEAGIQHAHGLQIIAAVHDFVGAAVLRVDAEIPLLFVRAEVELRHDLPLPGALIDGAEALVVGGEMFRTEIDGFRIHTRVADQPSRACAQDQFQRDALFPRLGGDDKIKQRAQPDVVVDMVAEPAPVAVTVPFFGLIAVRLKHQKLLVAVQVVCNEVAGSGVADARVPQVIIGFFFQIEQQGHAREPGQAAVFRKELRVCIVLLCKEDDAALIQRGALGKIPHQAQHHRVALFAGDLIDGQQLHMAAAVLQEQQDHIGKTEKMRHKGGPVQDIVGQDALPPGDPVVFQKEKAVVALLVFFFGIVDPVVADFDELIVAIGKDVAQVHDLHSHTPCGAFSDGFCRFPTIRGNIYKSFLLL